MKKIFCLLLIIFLIITFSFCENRTEKKEIVITDESAIAEQLIDTGIFVDNTYDIDVLVTRLPYPLMTLKNSEYADWNLKTDQDDYLYAAMYEDDFYKVLSDWNRDFEYIKEQFDCDNFGEVLKVYFMLSCKFSENAQIGIGEISIKFTDKSNVLRAHRINIVLLVIDSKVTFRFIEPQNGAVFGLSGLDWYGKNVKIYKVEF